MQLNKVETFSDSKDHQLLSLFKTGLFVSRQMSKLKLDETGRLETREPYDLVRRGLWEILNDLADSSQF